MSDFHRLQVKDVIRETESCVTLLFDIGEEVKDDFKFIAGQYLTIKAEINGEEVRRAYSICTGPGSGITPVMSMIMTMLEEEPKSTAYLLYGSKNEDNIIFKNQLDELTSLYEGQIVVDHTLSKPTKEKASGLMGVFGKKTTAWRGLKGRIDSEKVAQFVQNNPPKSAKGEYYICGPGDMIETVQTTLMGNGVQKEDIHQEYFTSGESAKIEVVNASEGAALTALLNGKEIKLQVVGGKTILDTLLDAGHEAPYSCTSGACSSCMAKVTKGTVEMEACYALDDEEVAEGYILTCQSHPTSNEVEIEYED
ncbi:unnamed protein product [Cyprideis torosa]|uniref:Uncharacterized protein n=1 Tax=Cyprideis torosa TaxID=163714 RepID=A0A7R8WP66_9CRUS|nr:unnamed protein product [Cyprideis torosa]CAG0906991.1 unnamed protein product [Cyprideis torosa]